jgi:hypothetical protein
MKRALFLLLMTGVALGAGQESTKSKVSFVKDVVPVLTKAGCANSNCHGSIRGQNGFKLSLFGYEPELDYDAITTADNGRRIDRANPLKSLVLLKPTYQLQHGGGERFKVGSFEYTALLEWIRAGAPFDSPGSPRIRSLTVAPDQVTLTGVGTVRKLTAIATYTDGSREDVSRKVQYTPQDETVIEMSPDGDIKALRAGETVIMVRTLGKAVATRVAVVAKAVASNYPNTPRNNYIDEQVFAKLRRLNIVPSDLSTDQEFLRRVYLDVIGLLPTVEENIQFASSSDPQKRAKLIDTLLERPEYAEVWATRLSDLYRIGQLTSNKAARETYNWIRQSVKDDKPYNVFATELLTSSGGMVANPAAEYYRVAQKLEPSPIATNVSQTMLGIRLECSRCHNHPYEKWTLDDFWGFAAFFTRLKEKDGGNQTLVSLKDKVELQHPVTKKVLQPKFLEGDTVTVGPDEDVREKLAAWITSDKNPWFARNFVNRVWKEYMGRGLVEPVDDFRITNPPTNPELLDALANDFIAHKYSLRHLSRMILSSRAYQLSSVPNESNRSDDRNYSTYIMRRLMAETLLDTMSQVTGSPENYPGVKPGSRAMSVPSGIPNYFLAAFGRLRRDTICERDDQPAMAQAMHLIAGDTIQKKITAKNGGLERLLSDPYMTDEAILRRLFMTALVRQPSDREIGMTLESTKGKGAEERRKVFEDVLWTLLNSKEFMFNH